MDINDTPIRILLIEDDPGDARLIQEMLSESDSRRFTLVHEKWLSDGINRLNKEKFDILLLDLMLPESRGLDTLFKVSRHNIDTPIVVLTGLTDELTGTKAINNGAQDYLVKGDINSDLLTRSIRHAIERHRLLMKLKKVWQEECKDQERITQHFHAITQQEEQAEEEVPTSPNDETLKLLVPKYRDIILSYVRALRIREDRPSEKLRNFAAELVKAHAQAKDIIRIHLHVLTEFSSQMPSQKEERTFSNDARLVLVELMGNLLDMYRLKFLTSLEEKCNMS